MNGWRKRIGFISPTVLETIVHDFFAFAPPGIGFVGITSNISGWAVDQFEMALGKAVEDASYLAARKVDFIIHAGAPLIVQRGKGADEELVSRLGEATGLPATTSVHSARLAFEHLGMRRIAFASPYPEDVQRNTISFLRAYGYEIVKDASMNVGFRVLQDIPPHEIYKFAASVLASAPEADGLYIPCPQWQVQAAVEAIERDFAKPVVAGDPADFWAAFRALGIRDRIEGQGMLLRSLSEG